MSLKYNTIHLIVLSVLLFLLGFTAPKYGFTLNQIIFWFIIIMVVLAYNSIKAGIKNDLDNLKKLFLYFGLFVILPPLGYFIVYPEMLILSNSVVWFGATIFGGATMCIAYFEGYRHFKSTDFSNKTEEKGSEG